MAFYNSNAGKVYNVLLERKDRVVLTKDIRTACNLLKLDYDGVLVSLIRSKVLETAVFKGVYYVKSREERDLGTIKGDPFNVVARACNLKLKNGWYFGLATALYIEGLWEHQGLTGITVISKRRVQRAKADFAGMRVEFKQLSGVPFNKLVQKKGVLRYSKPARTMLDYAYFSARNRDSVEYAKEILRDIAKKTGGEEKLIKAAARLINQYPGLYATFLRKFVGLD
ncbi:MAG: hypothetical protein WCX64_06950 [Candidatus Micrarchaeia archaeon]